MSFLSKSFNFTFFSGLSVFGSPDNLFFERESLSSLDESFGEAETVEPSFTVFLSKFTQEGGGLSRSPVELLRWSNDVTRPLPDECLKSERVNHYFYFTQTFL